MPFFDNQTMGEYDYILYLKLGISENQCRKYSLYMDNVTTRRWARCHRPWSLAHSRNCSQSCRYGTKLGFPRISQTAAPLDSLFRLLQEKQHLLTSEETDQINLLISDLEEAVDIPGEQVVLGDNDGYEFHSHRGTFHVLLFGELDPDAEAISALKEIGYILSPVSSGSPPVDVATGAPAVLLSPLSRVSEAHAWLSQCGLDDDVPV